MKHLCFWQVTFFLQVKPDLLILVWGYCESLVNSFWNTFYFITLGVYNVFLCLLYIYKLLLYKLLQNSYFYTKLEIEPLVYHHKRFS